MFVNFNILNQLGSPAINSNVFANRPAAGQTGRLFVSTDTFEIYRDNGTTWDLIGGPGSSTITGTGTATQVAYFTSSQAIGSSANLYWDNTNTRLGIGTSTPGVRLDVHGTGNMLHLNSTSATANALMSFQRTGTNVWRLGDQYNGGANFFELHNTALSNNAIEVLAASNEATFLSTKTYSTGNAIGIRVQHNLTIPNGVNVGLAALGGVNSNLNLTLQGSTTVAATGRQGLEGSTSINFTGAGTLTMTQSSTVRAFSALSSVYAFNGSAVGTITHLAGLRICFPDNPGSAVNITNNYALLINDQTTGTGTVTYTNRWGIYQEGASDLNYFAANTLIGSTVNSGEKLQVTGNAKVNGIAYANQFIVGTPTDLTRSFAASGNANSIALWLEEYGNVTASADIFFIKGRGTDTAKLNVQVGDNLGGLIFTGYLNGQYNNSAQLTLVVTNLDTTNNQANADYVFLQSYNSVGFNENFRIIANGGDGYLRGKLGLGLTPTNDKLEVNGNVSIFGNKLYNGASSNSCGISLGGSAVRIDGFNGLTFAASAATVGSQTTRMFISSSTGNVIINNGSTDNGFALQVNGSITVSSELYLDNGAYVRFRRTSGNLSIQTLGILAGTDDVVLITTGDFYLRNGSAANLIKTTNAGNSEFLGNIKTGAPTGGTAAAWKLGSRVAATVVVNTTEYIEVDIGGTLYKLATVT